MLASGWFSPGLVECQEWGRPAGSVRLGRHSTGTPALGAVSADLFTSEIYELGSRDCCISEMEHSWVNTGKQILLFISLTKHFFFCFIIIFIFLFILT